MRLAHNVVVSDGLLDPNEEGMLDDFRREMELSGAGEVEYLELDGIVSKGRGIEKIAVHSRVSDGCTQNGQHADA